MMLAVCCCALIACDSKGESGTAANQPPRSLAEARKKFVTALVQRSRTNQPVDIPPPKLFQLVSYPSPIGNLAAYLSVLPAPSAPGTPASTAPAKHPAIIWITGGFDNSIGDTAWANAPAENDQSVSAFRKAGIITMFPSLRGGNINPGYKEGLFGEVDDVLAAADFLAKQPDVDPARIYLGGHSTGGTLALLVAESSTKFRAVFSVGPVAQITSYPEENLPFKLSDSREIELRSPIRWLRWIHTPTYIFEGTGRGNIESLKALERANDNTHLAFHAVGGADHFTVLAPLTRLITEKILADDKVASNIIFTTTEIDELMHE